MTSIQTAAKSFLKAVVEHLEIPEEKMWCLISDATEVLRKEGAQVVEHVCDEALKDRSLREKQAQVKTRPSSSTIEVTTPPLRTPKNTQPSNSNKQ